MLLLSNMSFAFLTWQELLLSHLLGCCGAAGAA
jgi:hypothetical protein